MACTPRFVKRGWEEEGWGFASSEHLQMKCGPKLTHPEFENEKHCLRIHANFTLLAGGPERWGTPKHNPSRQSLVRE